MTKVRIGVALCLATAAIALPDLIQAQVNVDPSGTSVTSTTQAPRIRSARRAFTAILPVLALKDQPLGKVIDLLRADAGANIMVDWKTMEAVGVTKDSKITLTLEEISLGDALGNVMDQAHPTSPVLTYIDMNVIHITTQAEADKKLITRSYLVQDLTSPNVHLLAPQVNGINSGNQQQGGVQVAGGTQQQGLGGGTQTGQQGTANNQQNYGQTLLSAQKQAGQDLVNLVKTSIRPDIWSDGKGGGGPASISFFNGSLVVTAPIYVQEAIGGPVPGH